MPKMNSKNTKSVSFSSLGLKSTRYENAEELNWSKPSDWFLTEGDIYSTEFVICGGFSFHDKTNDVDKIVLEVREPGDTVKYYLSFVENDERRELLETVNLIKKQRQEITGCCMEKIPTKFQPYLKVISIEDAKAKAESDGFNLPF